MITNAKILIVKQGGVYDMSHLVSSIRWRGRKGSPARSLEIRFIDDDGFRRDRAELEVLKGHSVIFCWQGQELFRGMFITTGQARNRVLTARAHDIGIRLSNNQDTFCYTNKTASDIFIDVCGRFGVPTGEVANTAYIIPELPKPRATGWDVICDALSLTYKATGVRYYPIAQGENMSLLERRRNILQWVIETGVNLKDYSLTESIDRIKTRITMLSSEGSVLAAAQNNDLESSIGIFQEIRRVDDEMNEGQLEQLVNAVLVENNESTQGLTVAALGQPDVVSGRGVFVVVNPLDVSKTFYIETDSHVFESNYYSMTLSLVPAIDAVPRGADSTQQVQQSPQAQQTPQSQQQQPTNIRVGDIVNFSGGYHHRNSNASEPTGALRRGGPARCTRIAIGARWEYHLIGGSFTDVAGNSNVYGWVAASQVNSL